LLLETYNFRG